MKADLHFHPSFFSYGDKPHFTERKYPKIEDILKESIKKEINLLTITSCSTHEHTDKRWEAYLNNLDKENLNITQLSNQGLLFKNNSNQTYLIHGQELKTNKGDLNVIFAEKRVPIENSKGDISYILDAAKDCGENVLVGINQVSRCRLTLEEIRKLYEKEKIDFLESWNSFDFPKNNEYAENRSQTLKIPGIAVSDGHRLKDLGKAHIIIKLENSLKMDYSDLAKFVKQKITERDYQSIKGRTSLVGKGLYLARVTNAILFPNI